MKRTARTATPKGPARKSNTPRKKPPTPTRKLTDQQQLFAAEYVINFNATQAAIRAGYSARNASSLGYQLLQKTPVLDAVEKAKAERLQRAGIRADAVLLELAKIGFSSQRHLITVDSEGNVHLRAGDDIPPEAWDAVKSITAIDNESSSESETPNGATRTSHSRNRTVSVVMHDKRAALVDLGRHLGLFKDQLELTGKNGGPVQTEQTNALPEDQRAERLLSLLSKAAARKDPSAADS